MGITRASSKRSCMPASSPFATSRRPSLATIGPPDRVPWASARPGAAPGSTSTTMVSCSPAALEIVRKATRHYCCQCCSPCTGAPSSTTRSGWGRWCGAAMSPLRCSWSPNRPIAWAFGALVTRATSISSPPRFGAGRLSRWRGGERVSSNGTALLRLNQGGEPQLVASFTKLSHFFLYVRLEAVQIDTGLVVGLGLVIAAGLRVFHAHAVVPHDLPTVDGG